MNERKEEIRREDKKWSGKFALIMVLACLVGIPMGFGIGRVMDWVLAGGEGLAWLAGVVIPTVALILEALVVLGNLIALPVLWAGGKKLASRWDGEDEDVWMQIDRRMSVILAVTNLSVTAAMTLMGIAVSGFVPLMEREMMVLAGFDLFGGVPLMLAELALAVVFQRRVVNFYKEHNPEKRGSIYQVNFNKVWLESCDEAEKLFIYRAGYKAYRVGYYTCIILWVLATLGAMAGIVSWFGVLFVGIILVAMQAAYLHAARRSGNNVSITI